MAFFRLFSALVLSAAVLFTDPAPGVAQSLSDASLALNASWSTGYMGLGGNLGTAMVNRHKARHPKTARAAKSVRQERRPSRRNRPVAAVSYNPNSDTPIFLIAQALDHTGMNVNMLRIRTRGP